MTGKSVIRVLCVESKNKGDEALKALLVSKPGLEPAAEASDEQGVLSRLEKNSIDVALIDQGMPDLDAIELTRQIREAHPKIKVLIVTSSETPGDIFEAMDAGADGYVLKDNASEALEIAIRSVKLRQVWLDPGIAQQVLQVIEDATSSMRKSSRVLPTGLLTLPLMPEEKSTLSDVAAGTCVDGVCMVDADFVKSLRRFAPKD